MDFLSSLFPEHKFILIDEDKFLTQETNNVQIINQKFTKELCEQYAKDGKKYLLISSLSDEDKLKYGQQDIPQKQIELNVEKQINEIMEWIKVLKPIKAMIKFRCPYPTEFDKPSIQMLDGDILIAPWGCHSRTEARLITSADKEMIEYNLKDYEEKLFYINDDVRIEKEYDNPVKGKFLNPTYDGSSETIVIYKYLQYNKDFFYDFKLYKRIFNLS